MKWVLAEPDAGAAAALAVRAGLTPLVATLMVNRGLQTLKRPALFFSCELSALSDPALFLHMDRGGAAHPGGPVVPGSDNGLRGL